MKTTEIPSKDRAQDLLSLAEDYAAAAMGGVICELEEDPAHPDRLYRNYAHLTTGLEVHFLFPNLSPVHQRLISQLMEARNALQVRQTTRNPRRTVSGALKTAAERRLMAWRRRYQQLRTRAESLRRLPELTAVQREVLKNLLKGAR